MFTLTFMEKCILHCKKFFLAGLAFIKLNIILATTKSINSFVDSFLGKDKIDLIDFHTLLVGIQSAFDISS